MEQQTSRAAETEQASEQTMSSEAAAEALAIANQQERIKKVSDEAQEKVESIDDLLNDIESELEEESLVLNFKQKGGQ